MTRNEIRAELLELATSTLASPSDASKVVVNNKLSDYVFFGASPNEPRGIDNADLTDNELNRLLSALPVTSLWATAILLHLDPEA